MSKDKKEAAAADAVEMVRVGDSGPDAVIARVTPEGMAAAIADGWVVKPAGAGVKVKEVPAEAPQQ